MGTISPLHVINNRPLHSTSNISSPARELERLAKARSKLLESACNQTPTLPPETREQLRYVSKDGKCSVNLCHFSERGRFLSDIFTSFLDLQYHWFLFIFMMCYITTWFLFAGLYFYLNASFRGELGQEQHLGTSKDVIVDQKPCYIGVDGFISALLFSVETQCTICYGSRTVSPSCHEGVLLVMMQCIVGSMIDALMVGCMFVKISRPKKRAETLPSMQSLSIPGKQLRASSCHLSRQKLILVMKLGRLFLVEPQVIQHNIDSNSPLWDLRPEQLRRQQFEIIVILEGHR